MLQQRQLAAIMFTDIEGYTAMMQKNEQQAIKVIKHHILVLEKKVADHEGDVVEYYGDGSLSIFSSVNEAWAYQQKDLITYYKLIVRVL